VKVKMRFSFMTIVSLRRAETPVIPHGDRKDAARHRRRPVALFRVVRGGDPELILEEDAREKAFRYVPRMQRFAQFVRRYGFDVLIVVTAAESAIELAARNSDATAPTSSLWFSLPVLGAVILPLLARRRFPLAAPATTLLLAAGLSFVDGRIMVFTNGAFAAGLAGACLLGSHSDAVRARIGLVIAAGGVTIVVANDPLHTAGEVVVTPMLYAIAWLAGFALTHRGVRADAAEQRAELLEQQREVDALRAVVEERTRIARELHDIVGHSVSVMTVQTSGVRRLLRPDQEKEREALLAVERTGREALAEMRQVVGALRDPAESPALAPQPSLSRVDKLVAQARDTGLPVDLEIEGEPVLLPAGVDLTAYRLVQEGLTNTIKHAAARHAQVRIRYETDHVEVEVCDDGRGAAAALNANGGGHGLVGIRERVSIYGGELEAKPRPGGGFRLRARFPVSS
jgi:signal transduction histidine kinase